MFESMIQKWHALKVNKIIYVSSTKFKYMYFYEQLNTYSCKKYYPSKKVDSQRHFTLWLSSYPQHNLIESMWSTSQLNLVFIVFPKET